MHWTIDLRIVYCDLFNLEEVTLVGAEKCD